MDILGVATASRCPKLAGGGDSFMVPRAGGNSFKVPRAGGNSFMVPRAGGNSFKVPRAGGNSFMVTRTSWGRGQLQSARCGRLLELGSKGPPILASASESWV